jgi:ABC-type multidrug transport system fused ATPase/permease subunit
MKTWFEYLKRGLSRDAPADHISRRWGRDDKGPRGNLKNLRPFLARHWRKGVAGACIVGLGALLSYPQPLLTRALIDDVILGGQPHLLALVVALMAGVKLLSMLLQTLQRFYFARFEQEVVLDIQHDLLGRTLRFPKSFFDDEETGYLMSRLTSDVGGLRWFFSSTLVRIASNTLRFVGGAVFLFSLEWRLAIVAIVVLPILMLCVRYFSGKTRALSHQRMERHASVSRRLQESLSSTSLIKAFASEEREVGRMMGELQDATQISLEQTAVSSVASVAISGLGEIAKLIVLVAGAYLVITGDWSLGSLLAFQAYIGFVYGPAQFLANANLQLQEALAALERVSALFDIVPEETGVGIPVEHLSGAVEFRDVSFTYDEKQPVLQNVSCRIRPGEHLAIVGPSGVGKTTLISLLLRFYRPTAGEIWLDGQRASDYEVQSLRRRIGYVSQSTLLLAGTIGENLRYGNPGASEADVIHAAQIAGIHDFVVGLPAGYDSPVGEQGVNLSEGQKQRLAIARALIKDPDILVLDEPTSALDSLIEKSIFDALPEVMRKKTLFVVAHRLSTVQNSDRILLLNKNRLIAMGTHQELLDGNAFYRSLVANQQILVGGNTSPHSPS